MKASIRNSALAALVLFVQCAALGWLIWRYERIVRFGTEVRFRCTAYDPYDPLRGRYLRTTVREQCSSFIECSAEDFSSEARGDFGYREPNLYAKLEPSTNGLWCVAAVAEAPQSDGGLWVKPRWSRVEHSIGWSDKRKDESYDAFEKRRDASPLVATVCLPDQLFVNERIAPEAEKVLQKATSAKGAGAVAVYRANGGEIVITDIEIDGKSVTALARESLQASRSGSRVQD